VDRASTGPPLWTSLIGSDPSQGRRFRPARTGALVCSTVGRPSTGAEPHLPQPDAESDLRSGPAAARSRKWNLVAHLGVVLYPLPCSPSRQPSLVLLTANSNASSTERVGVIGDPELVSVGHDHTHGRLPPIAICARLPSSPYASRPRRWVHRHLLDQSTDPAGDEPILLNRPLARTEASRSSVMTARANASKCCGTKVANDSAASRVSLMLSVAERSELSRARTPRRTSSASSLGPGGTCRSSAVGSRLRSPRAWTTRP